MLNFGKDIFFQQDNASVHQSKIVHTILKEIKMPTMLWPAKSSDINIAEVVWKAISDDVYDGPTFSNKEDLVITIKTVINRINCQHRPEIQSLYESIRSRLCKILQKAGNLYNTVLFVNIKFFIR